MYLRVTENLRLLTRTRFRFTFDEAAVVVVVVVVAASVVVAAAVVVVASVVVVVLVPVAALATHMQRPSVRSPSASCRPALILLAMLLICCSVHRWLGVLYLAKTIVSLFRKYFPNALANYVCANFIFWPYLNSLAREQKNKLEFRKGKPGY